MFIIYLLIMDLSFLYFPYYHISNIVTQVLHYWSFVPFGFWSWANKSPYFRIWQKTDATPTTMGILPTEEKGIQELKLRHIPYIPYGNQTWLAWKSRKFMSVPATNLHSQGISRCHVWLPSVTCLFSTKISLASILAGFYLFDLSIFLLHCTILHINSK